MRIVCENNNFLLYKEHRKKSMLSLSIAYLQKKAFSIQFDKKVNQSFINKFASIWKRAFSFILK